MGLGLSLLSEIVAVVPIEAILDVMLLMLRIATATSAPARLETLGGETLVKVVLPSSLGSCPLVMLPLLLDACSLSLSRLRLL